MIYDDVDEVDNNDNKGKIVDNDDDDDKFDDDDNKDDKVVDDDDNDDVDEGDDDDDDDESDVGFASTPFSLDDGMNQIERPKNFSTLLSKTSFEQKLEKKSSSKDF